MLVVTAHSSVVEHTLVVSPQQAPAPRTVQAWLAPNKEKPNILTSGETGPRGF